LNNGHLFGIKYASAGLSEANKISEITSGITLYNYILEILANDKIFAELPEKLSNLCKKQAPEQIINLLTKPVKFDKEYNTNEVSEAIVEFAKKR